MANGPIHGWAGTRGETGGLGKRAIVCRLTQGYIGQELKGREGVKQRPREKCRGFSELCHWMLEMQEFSEASGWIQALGTLR